MQPCTFIKAPEKLHKEKDSFKIQSRKVRSPMPVLQALSTLLSLGPPPAGSGPPCTKSAPAGLDLSRLPDGRPLVWGLRGTRQRPPPKTWHPLRLRGSLISQECGERSRVANLGNRKWGQLSHSYAVTKKAPATHLNEKKNLSKGIPE